MTDPFSAKQKYGDRPAVGERFLRILGFLAALALIPCATLLPLFFLSNELQEAKSARQWGGNPILGTIIAVAISLAFASASAFGAFLLFRFALKKRRPRNLPQL